MTWPGHIVFTGALGLAVGVPLPAWPGMLFGAIFPDWAEMRIIPHRTVTHSIVFWLIVAGLVFGLSRLGVLFFGLDLPETLAWMSLKGFFFGVFSHLVADSASITGISVFVRRPRVALRLYSTGEFSEFATVSTVAIVAMAVVLLKTVLG